VVEIFNVFETLDGFAFELELMESLDLFDKLSGDGVFSETAAKHVVLQLVDAVDLCLRLGIAHRDVKLSNITFPRRSAADLLEARELGLSEDQSVTIKLADFGMAGFVGADNQLKGRCGTPGYVAPDILRAGVNEGYGINVDMFSIGVVAYTILCGYEPFYGSCFVPSPLFALPFALPFNHRFPWGV
jgi:calcium/calmodulin-dependent protein kinase I